MPANSSDKQPKKRASGKQATRFFLNDEQLAFANSFIPEFESEVLKHDPHFEGRSKPVSDWSENMAKIIMGSPLFVDLPSTSGETLPAWIKTIKRQFSNHFVNTMSTKFFKKFYSDHCHCTSSTGGLVPQSHNNVQGILRSAAAIFKGDSVSPRELFIATPQNMELLKVKMTEISPQFPNLVGGGLRNKATALLWDALDPSDRETWEAAADKVLHDVQLNRIHFPLLMSNFLQALCERGCLGTMYMSFSCAYRDENDCITGTTLYSGFDSAKEELISSVPGASKSLASNWLDIANTILPFEAECSKVTFSLNEDGVPLFPTVDQATTSLQQLTKLLHDYLSALWDLSHHARSGTPSLPWEDLALNPSTFYDTKLFVVPIKLQEPDSYIDDPQSVYKLVKYFHDSPIPFCFYCEKDTVNTNTTASPMSGGNIHHVNINIPPASKPDNVPCIPSITHPMLVTPPIPSLTTPSISKDNSDMALEHAPSNKKDSNKQDNMPPAGATAEKDDMPRVEESAKTNSMPPTLNHNPTVAVSSPNSVPASIELAPKTVTTANETSVSDGVTTGSGLIQPESNSAPLAEGDGKGARKKQGRGKKSIRNAGQASSAPSVPPQKPALRKRKASISNITALAVSGSLPRKKRPRYFYEDGKGGYMNEDGDPVDSEGYPLPTT